jgi:hypothetical protein
MDDDDPDKMSHERLSGPFVLQSAETIRQGARLIRFLASHVEEDRVFRLALHDVLFLFGGFP